MKPYQTVYIVDDDADMRGSLCRMVRLAGLRAESFASAIEFLGAYRSDHAGCLLLDVRMPCMSGLELQEHLRRAHIDIPIIFLTGYGSVTAAVDAMKLGALDFLEKPFDNEVLLDRLKKALQVDAAARRKRWHHAQTGHRLARLTAREREVMEMLASGRNNNAIANLLGVSVRTVETHRSNIMDKMQADSLPDLVRMVLGFKAHTEDGSVT